MENKRSPELICKDENKTLPTSWPGPKSHHSPHLQMAFLKLYQGQEAKEVLQWLWSTILKESKTKSTN